MEAELAKAFLPWIGPLLRINVLQQRSDENKFVIALTFHHAVADGLSAVAFLNDLVRALNGKELVLAERRLSIEQLVRQTLTSESAALSYDASAAIADPEVMREIGRKLLWRPFEHDQPQVSAKLVNFQLTNALIKRSRNEGTTIHGALCAAVTRSNSNRHPVEHFSVLNPINIRSFVGVDKSEIGLFLTLAMVRYPLHDRLEFWDLARFFTSELQAARAEARVVQSVGGLEKALPPLATPDVASGLVGSRNYDAVVSNLGAIKDEVSGPIASFDAIWGPMVLGRIRNERMIGATSYRGELRLTETRPIHLPERLGQVIEALTEACDG